MSNTQGEQPTSRRGKIVTAIVATVFTLGAVGFGTSVIAFANANAAAHTQLMAGVKIDGQELGAAAKEDAALAATAVEAGQNAHIQAVAAEQVAVKVAAEQAAAAEAARVAAEQAAAQAAAQQAAQQQATRQAPRQQAATGGGSSDGAPSGTPVPFYPSSDPNNAGGGDYADPGSFCASRSASTINGVPTCD